jgi:Carboxypeptidase regulatory-like domain
MKRTILAVATAVATSFAWAAVALSAQVVGVVINPDGAVVPGVRIRAVNPAGATLGQGVTGADGRYLIDQLPNGQYAFKLDPLATGFQPGDGVGFLTDKGLTVDWKVSPTAIALDDAVPGLTVPAQTSSGTPDWVKPAAIGALVSGVVIGGTLGGLAAGGVIGGSSNNTPNQTPTSPSL